MLCCRQHSTDQYSAGHRLHSRLNPETISVPKMMFSIRLFIVMSLAAFASTGWTAPTHARHHLTRATRNERLVHAPYEAYAVRRGVAVSVGPEGAPGMQPSSSHVEHWGLTDDQRTAAGQSHDPAAKRGENKVRPLEWQTFPSQEGGSASTSADPLSAALGSWSRRDDGVEAQRHG